MYEQYDCQIYHVDLRQAAWFSDIPWSMMALVGNFAGVFSDKLIQSDVTVTFTRKIMQSIGWTRYCSCWLDNGKKLSHCFCMASSAVGLKSLSHCGFLVNLHV